MRTRRDALALAALALLVAGALAVPRRLAPDRAPEAVGAAHAPQPTREPREEPTREHHEELDFSALDSLLETRSEAPHPHHVPPTKMQAAADHAVENVLRMLRLDKPVEGERMTPPARFREEFPEVRAPRPAAAAPKPPHTAQGHARAPRPLERSGDYNKWLDDVAVLLEYRHDEGGVRQRGRDQQGAAGVDGAISAIQETERAAPQPPSPSPSPQRYLADFAPADDSDALRRAKQPSSKELNDWLKSQQPRSRFPQPPYADVSQPRFVETHLRHSAGGGGPGFQYTPSPFKHPPPPPVPPPPPPPPPPNFGPGSSFEGYRFVEDKTQTPPGAASSPQRPAFLDYWERVWPAHATRYQYPGEDLLGDPFAAYREHKRKPEQPQQTQTQAQTQPQSLLQVSEEDLARFRERDGARRYEETQHYAELLRDHYAKLYDDYFAPFYDDKVRERVQRRK